MHHKDYRGNHSNITSIKRYQIERGKLEIKGKTTRPRQPNLLPLYVCGITKVYYQMAYRPTYINTYLGQQL